jgi:hypothetical protein
MMGAAAVAMTTIRPTNSAPDGTWLTIHELMSGSSNGSTVKRICVVRL